MRQAITVRFDHTQVGCAVQRLNDAGHWIDVGVIGYGSSIDTVRAEREIVGNLTRRGFDVSVAA